MYLFALFSIKIMSHLTKVRLSYIMYKQNADLFNNLLRILWYMTFRELKQFLHNKKGLHVYRGSRMSAHALLHLLNPLGKSDKI